ncbi:hypothetical protein BGZ96_001432 [Linnemannia gamsii]|uniref:Uncharacterized protein n=1 Tax=Linnemannia gamsii TaxID=64522 RepID=A0ABQ7JMG3_9FUNG|nr:hypothetical protein BGZ96_001432 [Linnemannia gamsii]
MVTSLFVWNVYYDRVWLRYDAADMPRDPLMSCSGVPTKLHMFYVVAASYRICEQCARISRPWGPQKYAALPLPVPEWSSDGSCISLIEGEESMIRLCLDCRRTYFEIYPELTPSEPQDSYLCKQDFRDCYHLGIKTVKTIKDRRWLPDLPNSDLFQDDWSIDRIARCGSWYSEREALEKARFLYGGDIDILTYEENPQHLITESKNKMDAYIKLASYIKANEMSIGMWLL